MKEIGLKMVEMCIYLHHNSYFWVISYRLEKLLHETANYNVRN